MMSKMTSFGKEMERNVGSSSACSSLQDLTTAAGTWHLPGTNDSLPPAKKHTVKCFTWDNVTDSAAFNRKNQSLP